MTLAALQSIVGVLLCAVSHSASAASAAPQQSIRYRPVQMVKGADVAVCQAYGALLKQSFQETPPFCGHAEAPAVPGLASPPRRYLAVAHQARLEAQFRAVIEAGVGGHLPSLPEVATTAEDLRVAAFSSGVPIDWVPSELASPMDLLNDGHPVSLVYWPMRMTECGDFTEVHESTVLIEGDRQILVLDAAGNLDLARTIGAFSHSPGSGEPPERRFQMPFARIGTITTFGSKTYVDGVVAPEALNDKGASYRKSDAVFSVFEGPPAWGREVCRFVWRAKQIAPSVAHQYPGPGVAFRCDSRAQTFSIASVMETSAHEGPGRVPAPPGFEQVRGKRETTCRLGNSVLAVGLLATPPPERGPCGDVAQNLLTKLSLNGKSLLDGLPRYVNNHCLGYQSLHSVQVRRTPAGVEVETCESDWNMAGDDSYRNVRCETVKVSEK